MADSRYLTAYEHTFLPIGGQGNASALTFAEAEYLVGLGEVRKGFVKRGHQSIRLTQHCGIVNLGSRVLEILPKVDEVAAPEDCRGVMLRLLRQADNFPLFTHQHASQHLRPERLLEVFISAFFDSVAEIVRGGLLRQYKEHEDDLQVVRGRIMASRQFAVLSNRQDVVACRYDDLTSDNIWNRLLKAGLRAVRPWITSGELHRRWIELMVVFDEAGDANADVHALKHLVFNRHATRYRAAVGWVRWILSLLSPALRAGENSAPGLLFDTNLLFQSAVASILRQRITGDFEVSCQESRLNLANIAGADRAAFQLRPDLVIRKNGAVEAIGDTKWKLLEVSPSGHLMPTVNDIYQMHAYAVRYRCENLALIYPWHAGLAGSKETTFELPAVGSLHPKVQVVCIDVQEDGLYAVRGKGACRFG